MIPLRLWQSCAIGCGVAAAIGLAFGDWHSAFSLALAGIAFLVVEKHAGPVL